MSNFVLGEKGSKTFKYIFWFVLGASCFYLSQPLLRVPLLNALQESVNFHAFAMFYPILAGILIAVSAGVFEEGFRFLYKNFLIRPSYSPMIQPILFGLGHGICEATWILLPPLLGGYPLSMLTLGIIERFFAIMIHVGLTIMVWNGFQKGQRWRYLFLAIAVHGAVNSSLILFQSLKLTPVQIEICIGVMAILLTIYSFYSRKYYTLGGLKNEEKDSKIKS